METSLRARVARAISRLASLARERNRRRDETGRDARRYPRRRGRRVDARDALEGVERGRGGGGDDDAAGWVDADAARDVRRGARGGASTGGGERRGERSERVSTRAVGGARRDRDVRDGRDGEFRRGDGGWGEGSGFGTDRTANAEPTRRTGRHGGAEKATTRRQDERGARGAATECRSFRVV